MSYGQSSVVDGLRGVALETFLKQGTVHFLWIFVTLINTDYRPESFFVCVFVSTEGLVLSSLEDSKKGNLSRLCGLNFADSLKKVTNGSCVVG